MTTPAQSAKYVRVWCYYGQPHWWALMGSGFGTSTDAVIYHGWKCQRCGVWGRPAQSATEGAP